uniref:Uncharacterized protein n=1 Tax=Paramormyrops kingsleyae TaxID=1676925 RepID=A0A3B3T910_9TELE
MTSLTQRSSGLVQRRTEASRGASADKERGSGDEDYETRRRDEQEDDDKGDSKETRLTLMEEVLLLGLKDREVFVLYYYTFYHAFLPMFRLNACSHKLLAYWSVIEADFFRIITSVL